MVLRPQQLTGLRQTSWLHCIYKNGRGFDFRTTNRLGSTPVSTLLRKLVRFFMINIFSTIIELFK